MRQRSRVVIVALRALPLAAVLVWTTSACGNGAGTPTQPSPVGMSVTIGGTTDTLKIGESVRFTATATQPGGPISDVTQWSTDTVGVMSVGASTGVATGVTAGKATLSASFDAAVGTRLIQVVPDYLGAWSGTYVVTSCSESGDYLMAKWCDAWSAQPMPIALSLGQTRAAVTGTMTVNEYTGSVAGPIADNGHLVLSGSVQSFNSSMTIASWSTNAPSPGSMTGTFSLHASSTSLAGGAVMDCQLVTLTNPQAGLRAGPAARR